MEKPLYLFGLYLGLNLLELCNGYPVDLHSSGFPNAELWTSLAPFLAVAFLVCSVLLVAGCLCCRQTKGFQEFTDSTSSHSLSATGGYVNNAASTTEFTIFPPLPAAAQRQAPGDRSSVVRFEPLPDIKPPQPHSRRPAAFNNVVSHGLSAQDWFEDPHVNFPRHQMKYLREMGRGWFGRVVEGEAQGIISDQKMSNVVVKILHEDATATDHMYFLHEVKAYRDLKHPNILRLLGRCLETDPFLVLLEACPSGDLKSFLSQNISTAEALSQQGVTLLMGCHIAAGLQHMHQHGFVHTDLAARNCLVTSDLTVKIGDYGTSIETFKEDYYCAGDVALPIRWCAPETLHCTETTIETKEVTPGANVWNLGVILWEICEFGKLPYAELTDDEVIVKVLGEGAQRLALPSRNCPHRQNLYLLMKLCWSPALQRPALLQVLAMLNHLYSSRDHANPDGDTCSLKTDEDFERRWETFKPNTIPKTDNHPTANSSTVTSPSHSYKETSNAVPPVLISSSVGAELNKQDSHLVEHRKSFTFARSSLDNIVITTQDSSNLMTDMNSATPLTTSPQPSITSSTGGEFFIPSLQQRHKSPSLQNLRGSLDDLCEDIVEGGVSITDKINVVEEEELTSETEVEEDKMTASTLESSEPEKSVEGAISEPDFDSWLQGMETTDEEDAKFVRKISEAIRDLDNALALEKTSSSSSSETSSNSASHHQSPAKEIVPPVSDQNVVLDFRLGPTDSSVTTGRYSFRENLFQPDSLQEDSLLEKSLPRENRATDSGTDTEDETWRRRIECGEFTQKVKEKSKSVADLMILTHIECSDGSDSEPPSLTWSFERTSNGRNSFSKQRRGSNLTAPATLAFGSESNIHQTTLGEEFRDTLIKLHEAQKDNRNVKIDSYNSLSLEHENKLEEIPVNLSSKHDPLLICEEDVADILRDRCMSTSSNHNREDGFLAIDASERTNLTPEVSDPSVCSEILKKDLTATSDSIGAEHVIEMKSCVVKNFETEMQNNRQVPEIETHLKSVQSPSHQKLDTGVNLCSESQVLVESLPLNIPFSDPITNDNNASDVSSQCAIESKLENDNVPQLLVIESTQCEVDMSSKTEVLHSEELNQKPLRLVSNETSDLDSSFFSTSDSNSNHFVDSAANSPLREITLVPVSASTPNNDTFLVHSVEASEQLESSVTCHPKRNLNFSENLSNITPVVSDIDSFVSSEKQSSCNLDYNNDSSSFSDKSFSNVHSSTVADSFVFIPNDKIIDAKETLSLSSVGDPLLSEVFKHPASTLLSTSESDSQSPLKDSTAESDSKSAEVVVLDLFKDTATVQSNEIDILTSFEEPSQPDHLISASEVTCQPIMDNDSRRYSMDITKDNLENNENKSSVVLGPCEDYTLDFFKGLKTTSRDNTIESSQTEESKSINIPELVENGINDNSLIDIEKLEEIDSSTTETSSYSSNLIKEHHNNLLPVDKINLKNEENVNSSVFSSPVESTDPINAREITREYQISGKENAVHEESDKASENISFEAATAKLDKEGTVEIVDETIIKNSIKSEECMVGVVTVTENSDSLISVMKPQQSLNIAKEKCSESVASVVPEENHISPAASEVPVSYNMSLEHDMQDMYCRVNNLHDDCEQPLSIAHMPSLEYNDMDHLSYKESTPSSFVDKEIYPLAASDEAELPSVLSAVPLLDNSYPDPKNTTININQGKAASCDFLQQEIDAENYLRDISILENDVSQCIPPEQISLDVDSDLNNKEVEVNKHINKELDMNILGTNNFSLVEDKLNNFSSSLCVPSLNFISATPIHSGRNSPELVPDEENVNIDNCVPEDEMKVTKNSPQVPLPMNIVPDIVSKEISENKLQNSSVITWIKNVDELTDTKSCPTLEKVEHENLNAVQIPATLSLEENSTGLLPLLQEKSSDLATENTSEGDKCHHISPSPNDQIVFDTSVVNNVKKCDLCNVKTDINNAQSIISQLTKEVPLKVVPSEECITADVTLFEVKQTVVTVPSSPVIEKQELINNMVLAESDVYEQLNLEEKPMEEETPETIPQSHQFCFTESRDTFMKTLSSDSDSAVENWKKQNIELLAEDFLQAALEVKKFDDELGGQDFSSMFQVGGTETPVELEDDGDDFGLDVAKHSTPDDERSSDSGFRDKGSLSESCEDACDEKYNLEDIEAELEETFNKGGFNYVVKGLDGDDEDMVEHTSVHLDVPEDLESSNKLSRVSEEMFMTSNSDSSNGVPEGSLFLNYNEPKSPTNQILNCQSDKLEKNEDLIKENYKAFLDDTLIPHNISTTLLNSSVNSSSTYEKDVLDFEADELDNSGISTPDKTFVMFQNAVLHTPDLLNIESCDTPMPDLTSDRNKSNANNCLQSPIPTPINSNGQELKSAFSEGFDIGSAQSRFTRENDLVLDIGETEFRTFSPDLGGHSTDFLDHINLSPLKRTGWFLHPPTNDKSGEINYGTNNEVDGDMEDLFMSPKSTSSTSSKIDESNNSENSYIPFSLDEEFVTAIRNELQEKLPCARQHSRDEEPEDDGVIDPEDELSQEERTDINIHYNVYPAPLSPILEERESVSSITTTVSDNYSPFVSNTKEGMRQDSDSEPTSPVFNLDPMDPASREADAKRFEEEIREALENCSLSSGETDSGSDKGQQNSSVLFEDLDQSPPSKENEQLNGKHTGKNVTLVRGTFLQPEYDDDFLVVDTETNKATLLESPKPKSYLAFVNNKRPSVDESSLDPLNFEEEMSIGVNSDTFLIKRRRIDDGEVEERSEVVDKRAVSDNEAFTPDSISPGQDRQMPSSSTLYSPDTDNMSEFFLTPSEKSSDERANPNTPLDLQATYNSYFAGSLSDQQTSNDPTYDEVQEISLGIANNEAAEIISELESSGIFNSITHEDTIDVVKAIPISKHFEEESSRTTSEYDDSEAVSLDESSDSLKSTSRGSEKSVRRTLSLSLPILEQDGDVGNSDSKDSPKKIQPEDCLEVSISSGSAEEEHEPSATPLVLNDTLDLYKKKKESEREDSSVAQEEKDWSVTSLEAALLSTKAPMPSPEEESWKQIPSMLAFSDLNEVISRCEDEEGFGEIMFTGPASPVYPNQDNDDDLMSTSFSLKGDSEELGDCYTPDWESGSEDTNEDDNNSSSSGEFIWKEGDREASVKAVDMSDSDGTSKPYEGISEFPMEVIAEEEEEEEDEDDEDEEDADGSSSCGSGTEFVPSAWNSEATPNRSALRSPDKKSDQKKNVSFKKQKYHCVYEYPREASDSESEGLDSPSRRRWELYQQDVDYSSYADWELMDGDVPEATPADPEADPDVTTTQPLQTFDFYKLSSVDYDFGNGVMSEDGEFYISSSARPFQFNSGSSDAFGGNGSQFFPGQLYQSANDEDSSGTTVAIKEIALDFASLDNNESVNDSSKMSTLGVSVDACEDEVDTSLMAVTITRKSVDPIVNQSENGTTENVRSADVSPVSSMHIRDVSHTISSSGDPISTVTDNSVNVEGCQMLPSTDDLERVKMDNSTSTSSSNTIVTSDTNAMASHEVNTQSITSSINVSNSVEKDLELTETSPDFSPSSPLSPTSGLGELRHTRDRLKLDLPASSSAFILDPPALGKRRSVEAVKGEASLLDSGEETEDSGIESSNGTTTSRATNRDLEHTDPFVLSSSKV